MHTNVHNEWNANYKRMGYENKNYLSIIKIGFEYNSKNIHNVEEGIIFPMHDWGQEKIPIGMGSELKIEMQILCVRVHQTKQSTTNATQTQPYGRKLRKMINDKSVIKLNWRNSE